MNRAARLLATVWRLTLLLYAFHFYGSALLRMAAVR